MRVVNKRTHRDAMAVEFVGAITSPTFFGKDCGLVTGAVIINDNGKRFLTSREGLYLDYAIAVPEMPAKVVQ
jgi:hypothetical protein